MILIPAMDCVMSLKKIASSERHVAGETLEGLNVGVGENMSFEMLVPCKRVTTVCAENHCVIEGGVRVSMETRTCSRKEE